MIAFHVESLTINFYNKLRVKFQKNVKWISFSCRSDVNSRATKKNWVFVLEDMNSSAVHTDIAQDYSAQAVLLTLRRFGSVRCWPGVTYSDPGSQLESASGKLET